MTCKFLAKDFFISKFVFIRYEMMDNYSINILSAYIQKTSILIIIIFSACMLDFASSSDSGYSIITSSLSYSSKTVPIDADESDEDASLQLVEVVPFNNTTPTSVAVDTLRNLVYVAVNPGYPYNYTLSLCAEENATSQLAIANSLSACSAIYVLDGSLGLINDIIRLGPGEQVKDIDIDAEKRMLYASGEYNYLDVDPLTNGEVIQFEDDVVYIIDNN